MILWFWFVILTILTLVDLWTFVIKNCLESQRYKYVKKHVLIFSDVEKNNQSVLLHKFATKYLKPDVVLVMKILATNVNGLVVSELVKYLWQSYLAKTASMDKLADSNINIDLKTISDIEDDENQMPGFPVTSGTINTDDSNSNSVSLLKNQRDRPILRNPSGSNNQRGMVVNTNEGSSTKPNTKV